MIEARTSHVRAAGGTLADASSLPTPRDPFFRRPVAAESAGKGVTTPASPLSSPLEKRNPEKNSDPKISEPKPGSFFLILDSSLVQFYRRPRSKKRRILKKWRARAENYRPNPWIIEQRMMMGARAMDRAVPADPKEAAGAVNYEYPVFKMHPESWAALVKKIPQLEACAMIRTEPKPWMTVEFRGPKKLNSEKISEQKILNANSP